MKYTPIKFDGNSWFAMKIVDVGETYPIGYEEVLTTEGGHAIGWMPVEFTDLVPLLNRAFEYVADVHGEDYEFEPGIYEMGPPALRKYDGDEASYFGIDEPA